MAEKKAATTPGGADKPHRFVPSNAAAHRENLTTSGLVFVLGIVFLWWGRNARDLPVILLICSGAAVFCYVFYSLIERARGGTTIEITDEALVLRGKKSVRTIPWHQIEKVDRGYYGGDRWALKLRGEKAPQILFMNGFSFEQSARIGKLIQERQAAARRDGS